MANKVIDVDWKFGVTAACSEKQQTGKTFLQLKIVLDNGSKLENIHVEMTLPQFYTFLHELENAKNSMEYVV